MRRRVGEAVEAMQGTLISGDPGATWSGACLDSRQVAGGELFFALEGARTDGHLYAGEALARGAAAAVVEREVAHPAGAAMIRVNDTVAALHRLTRAMRAQVPRGLVAVTGSTGKTTTKDLLAAMLGRRFRVAKSPGNLNNLYGFPLALLGIPDDSEWMVAEMGMSTPGELGAISRLGSPDAVVFTNVRPVHLDFFGTLERIAEAKAEILAGLAPHGLVVANADDRAVAGVAPRHRGRLVWYGIEAEADVRAGAVEALPEGGSRFRLSAGGRSVAVRLPLHGAYNVENCLAAAACAWALGLALEEIAAAAAEAAPGAMRGIVHRLAGGTVVVDDCYNSNPDALAKALAAAAGLGGRRRWAVLGDMLELGPRSPDYHREAGRAAAGAGFSPIAGVGNEAHELVAAARAEGAEAHWFASAREAAPWAAERLAAADVVLVKGSRGVGLEVVVEALLRRELH